MDIGTDEASSAIAALDLAVPSMVCDGCAEKIRTALTALPGVREVKVSLWRKRVRVRYEPHQLATAQLTEAIGSVGFTIADS